jgi:murein DD-endopeptidase MepM/ murein hydrolase activator NlpD
MRAIYVALMLFVVQANRVEAECLPTGPYSAPVNPTTTTIRGWWGEFYSPRQNGAALHNGIDIVPIATFPGSGHYAVRAIARGRVMYSRHNGTQGNGFGNTVVIAHDGDCNSGYAHLAYTTAIEDTWVESGDVIGYFADMTPGRNGGIVGSTGNAITQGPIVRNHLHFFMFTANSRRQIGPVAIPGRQFVNPTNFLLDGLGFQMFYFEPSPPADRRPEAMRAKFPNVSNPLVIESNRRPPAMPAVAPTGATIEVDDHEPSNQSTPSPAAPKNLRIVPGNRE